MAETLPGNSFILKQAAVFNRTFFFGTASQTVTVNLSKNSLAFAPAAGAVSEVGGAGNGDGWYNVALTAVDTNTQGILAYHCTASSGGPADFADIVEPTVFSDLSISGTGLANITSNIKKNAAFNGFQFIMTVNGVPTAGLGGITAKRSLDGAGYATCANAVTEVGGGTYAINLATTDTNGNSIMLQFTSTGADTRFIFLVTQP